MFAAYWNSWKNRDYQNMDIYLPIKHKFIKSVDGISIMILFSLLGLKTWQLVICKYSRDDNPGNMSSATLDPKKPAYLWYS